MTALQRYSRNRPRSRSYPIAPAILPPSVNNRSTVHSMCTSMPWWMLWSWSVRIISRPVRSPTCTSRGYACPPKLRCRMRPSGVRSNSAPHASSSRTRAGDSCACNCAMRQLFRYCPPRMVSAKCTRQLSRSSTLASAAATPPSAITVCALPTRALREPHRLPHVVRQEAEERQREVEEIAVRVLEDQRKRALAEVAGARLADGAVGRVGPEGFVIGAAVVVAGKPEAARRPENKERGRPRQPRRPPVRFGAEPAAGRLAEQLRRVERRQVRPEVVVIPLEGGP